MPSNDNNARLHLRNWDGKWTPVGWLYGDPALPVQLANVMTTAYRQLMVAMDPMTAFGDTFEGSVVDTINRWNVHGTVSPTQSQGNMAINPGATASATSVASSQATLLMAMPVVAVCLATFETSTATGNHRFFGLGQVTGNVGTAAAPLTDAVGYEVDTSGVLRASVYDSGTRVFTQALTMPTDGIPHLLYIMVRGDVTFFYFDDTSTPVATTMIGAASQNMPLRMHSLNSASVTGTPTMLIESLGVMDMSRQATAISDGTYTWRKVKVDPQGAMSIAPRAADLAVTAVGASGNSVTCTLPAAGPGQYHYIAEIQITKYCTSNISGNATPITVTTTNLPGSMAYTFETAQAIGTNSTRNNDYALPLKSVTANTATTVVCPAVTNSLWRVTISYYTGL